MQTREDLTHEKIDFYFVSHVELHQFARFKKDETSKLPTTVEPVSLNFYEFENWVSTLEKENKQETQTTEVEATELKFSRYGNRVSEKSFEFITLLGKGTFGKVILSQKKDTKELYAIKVIPKV